MASPSQITDRAKRYRAQKQVSGPKRCAICGKGGKLDVMHLTGNEAHGEKENLAYGCRSCNTALGAAFKRIGAGKPTNQYNPSTGVPSFAQYAWAVSNHSRGAHDEGGKIIHATPKHKRIEYARRILSKALATKRAKADERWNPVRQQQSNNLRGKRNPAQASAEVFEEFHGYEPLEVVKVSKWKHHHDWVAAAGQLVGLKVRPINGSATREIEGLGDDCFLCFNEAKNQLFVEGGDQKMSSSELKRFGVSADHELHTLGKLVAVGYFTNKTHLDASEGGEAVYSHTFRMTNKNGRHVTVKIAKFPDLIYRVLDEQFEISGGDYLIRAEGIDK